jgi:type I restriction enzyme S subunit
MIETPYGSFPDNYHLDKLEDLCVKKTGIQTGPFGSQLHNSDYVPVGTPILTVEHLGENRILHGNIPRITEEDRERLSRYSIKKGDIIFSRVGSVDRRALVRKEEEGWLFSGRCLRVRPNPEKLDSVFLSYLMGLPSFQEYIRKIAVGATMPSINTEILSSIQICYPPLPTQHAIARILGSLDDKIELNRQMNETLEAMARGIFQSWFVDFDPIRANSEERDTGLPQEIAAMFPDRFEEVEGWVVPRGWEVKPLDQIATFLNGLALQKYPPDGEDYLPVIKIAQLHKGDTEGSDKASVEISPEYIMDNGDILFSWSGSLEVVIWCGGKGALNQHLFKVSSEKYPKWFYYLWVLHHLPDFQLIAEGKATTMGHIQRYHLSDAMVVVPPSDQIGMMDEILSPILNKIITNNVESRTLAQIRDALLPKLMSGEIRVDKITA